MAITESKIPSDGPPVKAPTAASRSQSASSTKQKHRPVVVMVLPLSPGSDQKMQSERRGGRPMRQMP